MDLSCDYLKMKHPIAQKALYALLEVKDSDLRLDTVSTYRARDTV